MTHTENNELTAGPGAEYQPGELVDVTIRNARVCMQRGGFLLIDVGGEKWRTHLNLIAPGVAVTRVGPPEWPPLPGDVWADKNGQTWAVCGDGAGGVEMRPHAHGRDRWSFPVEVSERFGPMRLEYRPGWTRQPDPDPAGPTDAATRKALEEPTQVLPTIDEPWTRGDDAYHAPQPRPAGE